MSDEIVPVGEQADIITGFIEGLLDALGIDGSVNRTQVDDETIELDVVSESSDLGLLIGPKGQTLSSVHELARAVLQRRAPGRHDGRVRIDIGGYRHRRREALARFVQDQATAVVESGVSRALEPMNAVDRKVVHDTVNEMEGVSTISEGLDPDRRVVIVPDTPAGWRRAAAERARRAKAWKRSIWALKRDLEGNRPAGAPPQWSTATDAPAPPQ